MENTNDIWKVDMKRRGQKFVWSSYDKNHIRKQARKDKIKRLLENIL